MSQPVSYSWLFKHIFVVFALIFVTYFAQKSYQENFPFIQQISSYFYLSWASSKWVSVKTVFGCRQVCSFQRKAYYLYSHWFLCQTNDLWHWPTWIFDQHEKWKLCNRPSNIYACIVLVQSSFYFLEEMFLGTKKYLNSSADGDNNGPKITSLIVLSLYYLCMIWFKKCLSHGFWDCMYAFPLVSYVKLRLEVTCTLNFWSTAKTHD